MQRSVLPQSSKEVEEMSQCRAEMKPDSRHGMLSKPTALKELNGSKVFSPLNTLHATHTNLS